MIGTRFRLFFTELSGYPFVTTLLACLYNGISGNTSGLSLMVSSMSACGTLRFRQALTMMIWGNPGSILILYLAVIDMRLAIFYILGISGIIFVINSNVRSAHLLSTLLGLALLYYGMDLVKQTTAGFIDLQWFKSFIADYGDAYIIAFVIGFIYKIIIRPALVLLVLAVALTQPGILPLELSIAYCAGIVLGGAFIRWYPTRYLEGPAKRLMTFQVFYYLFTTVLLVSLFSVEHYLGVPLLMTLMRSLFESGHAQLANIIVFTFGISALLATVLRTPITSFLLKIYPEPIDQDPNKPKYIYEGALYDPESAMDLVETEQFRLIHRIKGQLDMLRESLETPSNSPIPKMHHDSSELLSTIHNFLNELSPKELAKESFELYLNILHRNNTLTSLEESFHQVARNCSTLRDNPNIQDLLSKFIESLDIILMMLADSIRSFDPSDLELLHAVTDNRENLVVELRKTYLAKESSLEFEERAMLLEIFVSFEKAIWLTRQLCALLKESNRFKFKIRNVEE
jgi:phosphate:Na+ symporter